MTLIIKSKTASLYEGEERTDELLHGMKVTVEAEKEGLLRVRTDYGYCGWLDPIHTCEPENFTPTHYINAPAADILSAPKVQAPLLICLTLGCTIQAHAEDPPNWTKVTTADGRTGYIRTPFLTPYPGIHDPDNICQTALLYINSQYRWGGKSPHGIDCSGLCFMAHYLNGVHIFRDSRIEPGFPIKEIPPQDAERGDLLYFPGHVGVLLDKYTMLHSSVAGNGVKVEPLTPEWRKKITAAGSLSVSAS